MTKRLTKYLYRLYIGCCLKLLFIVLSCGFILLISYAYNHYDVVKRINDIGRVDATSIPISHVTLLTQALATNGTRMPLIHPPSHMSPPRSSNHSICVFFKGRLGNRMFQFASNFGTAALKGMSVVVSDEGMLHKIFKIDVPVWPDKILRKNCTTRSERFMCRYDSNLLKFDNNENYALRYYLQSWKYFYNASEEIRKQFRFTDAIHVSKEKKIKVILKNYDLPTRSNVTLIGVHVRRGDYLFRLGNGKTLASAGYLNKSVTYFLTKKMTNTLFLVFSDSMNWTKTHMPRNINVQYMTGNSAELDLAILASCDHVITTVGTFSWWAGWLSGGEVTFYQWPAAEGSSLRKHFSYDYKDFFYPGWVGFT